MKQEVGVESNEIMGKHLYRNNQKMVPASEKAWNFAHDNKMLRIKVRPNGSQNRLIDIETGHEFANMTSCSYLGLNTHPTVIDEGIKALKDQYISTLAIPTFRMRLDIMDELESGLSKHFGSPVIPSISCQTVSSAILPILGSGHLTNSEPLVMVFDRFSHFSLAFIKPIVGDETLVLTCPHNDMNYLEDICKKYPRVAYICDGVYSTGGSTKLKSLVELQEKYGLFLYIDDSHSLSTIGKRGEGYIRSNLKEMNDRTIIVASTAKAFGSMGGIAILGSDKHYDFLYRSGPLGWSQNLTAVNAGMAIGSLKVHKTPELYKLQHQLQENIKYFDEHINTPQRGDMFNIRVVEVGDNDRAVYLSKEIYKKGFYCSSIFFPIVPKGKAGIRIMLRGDLDKIKNIEFVTKLKETLLELGADNCII